MTNIFGQRISRALRLGREPAVTRDQVIAIYASLLDRQPETEDTIQGWINHGNLTDLVSSISQSAEFLARGSRSPFFHYAAMFDAEGAIRRHAKADIAPDPNYLTNFLGVRVDTKVLPAVLPGMEGTVEPVPIPANWHADIAEWAAALRAVELARERFTIIELGCGWGCWLNNAGAAARRLGLAVDLIGVEGDPGHVDLAIESTRVNGFSAGDVTILRGIAAPGPGYALFPRQDRPGEQYGLEPVFGASEQERKEAAKSGQFDELVMLPLSEILAGRDRVDLLHIDIQGGEADLIAASRPLLRSKFAYILIGTHSRAIEGKICEDLLSDGWRLEIERSAIVTLTAGGPVVTVDGVQGWRNMALLPD